MDFKLSFLELPNWTYAYGEPLCQGVLRTVVEDFVVDEELAYQLDGRGDYLWLQVRKRHTNTDWLARELAVFAGIKPSAVSYAGLKDRHALTTQWFSLHLADESPDWANFSLPGIEILAIKRHRQELCRGGLRGNHFQLCIRQLQGDLTNLAPRLQQIQTCGVPNYFGQQRFGLQGANLAAADTLFAGRRQESDRHKRGLYISAARSLLFNTVLAKRVWLGNWQQPLAGEVLRVGETDSLVNCEQLTPAIITRIAQGALHLTGPLWGRGPSLASGEVLELENAALVDYASWQLGLEERGLQQERRGLLLRPQNFTWQLNRDKQELNLSFYLPAGTYATTVVREVIQTTA